MRADGPRAQLPPATIVATARGEMFVRDQDGPADATPVVLLHGWMATADLNFHGSFAPLRGSRRVVAPDLREHGRSRTSGDPFTMEDAADDVAAILDALGIDRVIVAGYSLGGAVAQTFAHRHPARCEGVVLAATALRFGGVWRRAGVWRAGWYATWQRVSRRRGRGLQAVMGRVVPPADLAWMAEEIERGHPGGLRSAGAALSRFRGASMACPTMPAVCIVTTKDRLVPVRWQRELASAWSAEIVELEVGHLAPAPPATAARLGHALAQACQMIEGRTGVTPVTSAVPLAGA